MKGRETMQVFGPTRDCTPLDELTLLLEGREGEEVQRRARTHVDGCAYCRTELALLNEFESPVLRAGEPEAVRAIADRLRRHSPAKAQAWWKQLWQPRILVPASVALAAMLLAIVVVLPSRRGPGRLDVPVGTEVMRSQAVEAIAPIGDLDSSPKEMEWRPVADASRYVVRLMEVDRTVLWNTNIAQTKVAIPGAVQEKISPLKTLLWDVRALDISGNTIATSIPVTFRRR
jgi:hypothetical protein